MPDNELDLFQWQIGTQSLFATAVTPTAKLMGISKDAKLNPAVKATHVEEDRGTLTPAFNVTVDESTGTASLAGDATYEQIGYVLDSLLGTATPSGAGPYVRSYVGPGAKPASKMLTLMRGGTEGTYKLTGGIANEFGLKVESNKRAKFTSGLIGHSISTGSLAALADTAVNFIHANQATLFLDAWGGTIGTTAISATVFSIELGLNMNKAVKMGIGSLNPTGTKQRKSDPGSNQLKVAMELTSQSKAWLDSIIGATTAAWQAQFRMNFAIGANQILKVDFAGWSPESPEIFSDADGVAQVEFTLNPLYHTGLGSWLKIELTNQVAALP